MDALPAASPRALGKAATAPPASEVSRVQPLNPRTVMAPADPGPPADLVDVDFVTAGLGFGVTWSGAIYCSSDAGQYWHRQYSLATSRFDHIVRVLHSEPVAISNHQQQQE